MGGFPYEFGPETERKIPGHGGPIFSAHRLEGRFSDPRPHLEAQLPPPAERLRQKILRVPRWGMVGASRRRPQPREATRPRPLPPPPLASVLAPPPAPASIPLNKKSKKAIVKKSEASLLFHKLVSDRRLSCCAVESSMSDIRAKRARQLHQIASLVGLTVKFRPAARQVELARLRRFLVGSVAHASGAGLRCSSLALLVCSTRRRQSFARVNSQQTCCCAADRLAGRLSFAFCFLLFVARQVVCHNLS